MFLKRKIEKDVEVGDFCVIRSNILEQMKKDITYQMTSISLLAKISESYIYSNGLRNSKRHGRSLFIQDAIGFYVVNNPIKGILEVAPLGFDRDTSNGPAIRDFLLSSKKNSFYMKSKDFSISSSSLIYKELDRIYGTRVMNHTAQIMQSSKYHNSPDFSW